MDITVLSKEKASVYVPKKSAILIRIFDSSAFDRSFYPEVDPSLYKKVLEYTFDPIDPGFYGVETLYGPRMRNKVIFDEDIASQIIDEFDPSLDELVIHCNAGLNRSPAVAIALNEIFCLGHDTELLKKDFPGYLQNVYDTMLEVADGK